jgi:hypothetical protein
VLLEADFDAARDALYPLSGLKGNLVGVPTIGIAVGLNRIAESQLSGGPFQQLSRSMRQI